MKLGAAAGPEMPSAEGSWTMGLRPLRCFVRMVELGSAERASLDLQMPPSTLRETIASLQRTLPFELLQHADDAVLPTEAGFAFMCEAKLALQHLDHAAQAAEAPKLSGTVSIGLTPTACSVLGLPILVETRKRFPGVKLHIVESLSGHLADMLNARQLDLAVLYGTDTGRRWHVSPLVEERLFVVQSTRHPTMPLNERVTLAALRELPLILPSRTHGLRNLLDAAFSRARVLPVIAAEIDSLAMLMDAVDAGLAATIQPWAAIRRFPDAAERFRLSEISEREVVRSSSLCSLSHDEMSPAALAMRVLLAVCSRELVRSGAWASARIRNH